MASKKNNFKGPQDLGEWDTSVTDESQRASAVETNEADAGELDALNRPETTSEVAVSGAVEPPPPVEAPTTAAQAADIEPESAGTTIGPTLTVRGRLKSREKLVVYGRIEASVQSDKDLRLEGSGIINADIDVRSVWVSGIVVGDIRATELVELAPGSRVVGDIRTPRLILHDGAQLRGRVDMDGLQALEIVKPPTTRPAPEPLAKPLAAAPVAKAPPAVTAPAPKATSTLGVNPPRPVPSPPRMAPANIPTIIDPETTPQLPEEAFAAPPPKAPTPEPAPSIPELRPGAQAKPIAVPDAPAPHAGRPEKPSTAGGWFGRRS